MLVVTTTVRMVDGVHGNTTGLGPRVALDGELVLGSRGFEEGLVGSASARDDADHAAAGAGEHLFGAGGELDTGLALVGVVADNCFQFVRICANQISIGLFSPVT